MTRVLKDREDADREKEVCEDRSRDRECHLGATSCQGLAPPEKRGGGQHILPQNLSKKPTLNAPLF
jgi:hypothetical protein